MPARRKIEFDVHRAEIVEAFNRGETIDAMLKRLTDKGLQVNLKTFQRRLKEWGLRRYNKKDSHHSTRQNKMQRRSIVSRASVSTPSATSVAQSVAQSTTDEIPDSLQYDDNDESTCLIPDSDADSSQETEQRDESFTLRAYSHQHHQHQHQPQLPLPPTPPRRSLPIMSQKVWTRRHPAGHGLEKSLEAVRNPAAAPVPIPSPSSDVDSLKQDGDSFTLSTFTYEDAFELGHLLHARLLPHALVGGKPTVISIALANSGGQILFQTAVGAGSLPDNETWIQRKRNSVIRWGASTWLLHNKFKGDEAAFARLFGMSAEQAGKYAIHGGGVPIRVQGVEGVVAVVVVSGLKQDQDHGVIVDVIKNNWE